MGTIKNVAICGLGTMGSWIAPRIASYGFHVKAYDTNSKALDHLKKVSAQQNVSIDTTADIRKALENADLVLEMIVEDLEIKKAFFHEIDAILNEHSIVTSNTSIFLPTQFLEGFLHRNRFCCFHFYAPNTAVDIMPLPETDADIIVTLSSFAEKIGEVPITLNKLSPGYVFSAMAGAATDVALELVATGVADVKTVDSAWKAVTGMKLGPFAMLDTIGLDTSLRIRKQRLLTDPQNSRLKRGIQLIENYVDKGRLGTKTKRGFFDYEMS